MKSNWLLFLGPSMETCLMYLALSSQHYHHRHPHHCCQSPNNIKVCIIFVPNLEFQQCSNDSCYAWRFCSVKGTRVFQFQANWLMGRADRAPDPVKRLFCWNELDSLVSWIICTGSLGVERTGLPRLQWTRSGHYPIVYTPSNYGCIGSHEFSLWQGRPVCYRKMALTQNPKPAKISKCSEYQPI